MASSQLQIDSFISPFTQHGMKEFVTSIELERKAACDNIPIDKMLPVDMGAEPTLAITKKYPEGEAQARWTGGMFDASFWLTAYDSDVVRRQRIAAGRKWTLHHPWYWGYQPSMTMWGKSNVQISPSFAGLASSVVDAGTTSSWSSLLVTLGEGSTPANNTLISHVRARHNCEVNPVRYVLRLAAMYVMAKTLEAEGDELVVDSSYPPDVRDIGLTAHIQRLMDDSRSGSGVVYYRGGVDQIAEQTTLGVLITAASQTVKWRIRGSVQHSLAGFWPNLPPMIVGYTDIRTGPTPSKFTAYQVWSAAVDWCGRNSSVKLLHECVDYLVTMSVSPHDYNPITLSPRIQVYLPLAQMEGYALGPMMATTHVAEAVDFYEPDFAALVADGVNKSRMLGLLHWHNLWFGVLSAKEHGDWADSDAAQAFARYRMASRGAPVWGLIMGALGVYGPPNGVSGSPGRLLFSTVPAVSFVAEYAGGRTAVKDISVGAHFKRVMKLRDETLQWDEVLGNGMFVPKTAAIWGYIFPLHIDKSTYQSRMWGVPAKIVGANREMAECCASVHRVCAAAVWKKWVIAQNGNARPIQWAPATAYSKRISDYQFYSYRDRNHTTYTPMFQISDIDQYHKMTEPTAYFYHLRWFVDIGDATVPKVQSGTWLPNYDAAVNSDFDYDSADDSGVDDPGDIPPDEDDGEEVAHVLEQRLEPTLPSTPMDPENIVMEEYVQLRGVSSLVDAIRTVKGLPGEQVLGTDALDRERYSLITQLQGFDVTAELLNIRPAWRARAARHLARIIGYAGVYGSTSPDVIKDIDTLRAAVTNMHRAMEVNPALTLQELQGSYSSQQWDELNSHGKLPSDSDIRMAVMAGLSATQLVQTPTLRQAILRRAVRITTVATADIPEIAAAQLEKGRAQEAMAEDAVASVATGEEAVPSEHFLVTGSGGKGKQPVAPAYKAPDAVVSSQGSDGSVAQPVVPHPVSSSSTGKITAGKTGAASTSTSQVAATPAVAPASKQSTPPKQSSSTGPTGTPAAQPRSVSGEVRPGSSSPLSGVGGPSGVSQITFVDPKGTESGSPPSQKK